MDCLPGREDRHGSVRIVVCIVHTATNGSTKGFPGRKPVTSSVGTPLCPYWLSTVAFWVLSPRGLPGREDLHGSVRINSFRGYPLRVKRPSIRCRVRFTTSHPTVNLGLPGREDLHGSVRMVACLDGQPRKADPEEPRHLSSACSSTESCTGVPRLKEHASPLGPYRSLCLGSYGDSKGMQFLTGEVALYRFGTAANLGIAPWGEG